MMLAKPMMTASPIDVCLRAHGGKHRIIASETSNIMQAERLAHHIREANASLKSNKFIPHDCESCKSIYFKMDASYKKHFDSGAFLFGNDVCLRQMMLAKPMMTASPNDVCLRAHGGKHRIIARETCNIMQAKRLAHHIREANASLKNSLFWMD